MIRFFRAEVWLLMSDRSNEEQRLSATLAPTEHERLLDATSKKRWEPVWKQRLIVSMLVLSDVFFALVVWGAAYVGQSIWGRGELTDVAVAAILPSVMVWVALRALLGLYPGYGLDSAERLRRHVSSVCATVAILAVVAVGFQIGDLLSRLMLLLTFLGLLFVTPFAQYFARRGLKRLKLWGKPVIVLGYADTGAQLVDLLEREWGLGYRPARLFDKHFTPAGEAFTATAYADTLAEAMDVGLRRKIDTCIFATPYTRREQLADMVREASDCFQHILIIPNLRGVTNSAVVARDLSGTLALEVKQNLLNPWAKRLKRALDLFGVMVGGCLISPLLLTIAVLIKLNSRGPVLFIQERPGLSGDIFRVFKFRTMYPDAEQRMEQLFAENPLLAQEFEKHGKLRDDPRVTEVGRWLRKTSMDELPQLWNVLKGEMSLVGPRPYLVSQVPQMSGNSKIISRATPGMSGLWQVSGRSEMAFEQRVDLDMYYVRNWSVWLDLVILARTVRCALFTRDGAY
jgi:Undecaprenyl-phosphate galactose phosphotransferase WbaP